MTSPLSSKPGTARAAQRAERTERTQHAERTETVAGNARRSPAAPGPLASFLRFVVCGGGIGLASSPAVTLLALLMPWAVANALITVASTVLCTELHARFTFGTGRPAGWRQHWQSAGSATAAYAVTSVAMLVLHTVQPSAGVMREQVVYLGASGLAGIGRFLLLRLFVFTGRRRTAAPMRDQAQGVAASGNVSSSVQGRVRPKIAPSMRRTVNTSPSCPSATTGRSATTWAPVRRGSLCHGVGRLRATGFPVRSSIRRGAIESIRPGAIDRYGFVVRQRGTSGRACPAVVMTASYGESSLQRSRQHRV